MKDGYYWVKFLADEWVIVKYNHEFNKFFDPYYGDCFDNEVIDEIGDYIETPEKYKE